MHAWNIILNNQTSENQFVAIKEGLEIVDGYGRYPKESSYNNDFCQSLMSLLFNLQNAYFEQVLSIFKKS